VLVLTRKGSWSWVTNQWAGWRKQRKEGVQRLELAMDSKPCHHQLSRPPELVSDAEGTFIFAL
jgi:hypothetical protein